MTLLLLIVSKVALINCVFFVVSVAVRVLVQVSVLFILVIAVFRHINIFLP